MVPIEWFPIQLSSTHHRIYRHFQNIQCAILGGISDPYRHSIITMMIDE